MGGALPKGFKPPSLSNICAICLSTPSIPVELACQHAFCSMCLIAADATQHCKCPVCRTPHVLNPMALRDRAKAYRSAYRSWRQGGTKGAHGEVSAVGKLSSKEVVQMETEENALRLRNSLSASAPSGGLSAWTRSDGRNPIAKNEKRKAPEYVVSKKNVPLVTRDDNCFQSAPKRRTVEKAETSQLPPKAEAVAPARADSPAAAGIATAGKGKGVFPPCTPEEAEAAGFYTGTCRHEGCNYRTQSAGHMARHVRTHTRARPFVCPSPGCSYSAMQKDHLKTHMLTHSTVKAFACPHCSFKTKRKEHLTRHTRRRHRASAVLPASALPAAADSSVHKAVPKAVPKERVTVKTSRFRGVSWAKGIGVWRSQIMSDRKTKHLGTYHSEVEAARAYDRAARQLHGAEYLKVNFPIAATQEPPPPPPPPPSPPLPPPLPPPPPPQQQPNPSSASLKSSPAPAPSSSMSSVVLIAASALSSAAASAAASVVGATSSWIMEPAAAVQTKSSDETPTSTTEGGWADIDSFLDNTQFGEETDLNESLSLLPTCSMPSGMPADLDEFSFIAQDSVRRAHVPAENGIATDTGGWGSLDSSWTWAGMQHVGGSGMAVFR
jgi:hypothetical protein